jgi:hypothetical protein
VCRSLPASVAADSPKHDATTLLDSLRKAGEQATSAVHRVGIQSAGTNLDKTAEAELAGEFASSYEPRTPGVNLPHTRQVLRNVDVGSMVFNSRSAACLSYSMFAAR